jgi:hypothetical protein
MSTRKITVINGKDQNEQLAKLAVEKRQLLELLWHVVMACGGGVEISERALIGVDVSKMIVQTAHFDRLPTMKEAGFVVRARKAGIEIAH